MKILDWYKGLSTKRKILVAGGAATIASLAIWRIGRMGTTLKGATLPVITPGKPFVPPENTSLDKLIKKVFYQTASHESAYGGIGYDKMYATMNKDMEFEGTFDKPKKDKDGNKIPPEKRKNYPGYDPNGYSKYGPNPGHVGLSWGFVQFTQSGGTLGKLLKRMNERYPALFAKVFGECANELLATTLIADDTYYTVADPSSPTKKARRRKRTMPVCGVDIWKSPWTERFALAGKMPEFQAVQWEMAIELYFMPGMKKSAKPLGIKTEKGLAIVFDRSVQLGATGAYNWFKQVFGNSAYDGATEKDKWTALLAKTSSTASSYKRTKEILDGTTFSWNTIEV